MQGRVIFVTLLVASAVPGWAQTTSGALAGNVVDAQHGAVPNSVVTATEVENGFTLSAQTDDQGRFVFTHLPPGTYGVSAKAPDFSAGTRTNSNQLTINRINNADTASNGGVPRSRGWSSGHLSHEAREGEE